MKGSIAIKKDYYGYKIDLLMVDEVKEEHKTSKLISWDGLEDLKSKVDIINLFLETEGYVQENHYQHSNGSNVSSSTIWVPAYLSNGFVETDDMGGVIYENPDIYYLD